MLRNLFRNLGGRRLDESLLEEWEETLVMSDVSLETTDHLLAVVREAAKKGRASDDLAAHQILRQRVEEILDGTGDTKNEAHNEARAQARAQAQSRAEAEARAQAEAEIRARQEAKERAIEEARAKKEAEARAREEARAQARAEAEARAKEAAAAREAAREKARQEREAAREAARQKSLLSRLNPFARRGALASNSEAELEPEQVLEPELEIEDEPEDQLEAPEELELEDEPEELIEAPVVDQEAVHAAVQAEAHEAALEAAERNRAENASPVDLRWNRGGLTVWLFVGVNGVGKTTSIGKLAAQLVRKGHKPLLIAGDTFRAAAIEQLQEWGKRSGSEVVSQQQNADPAAVVFDGLAAAKARGCDVVLIDTAGRLHNKSNLMNELAKIARVIERETGSAPQETLLVIDASTGQNGLTQARVFADSAPLTGLILTKWDGTAKGGIVLTIAHETGLPVKLLGVGEKVEDLCDFDPHEWTNTMFGTHA